MLAGFLEATTAHLHALSDYLKEMIVEKQLVVMATVEMLLRKRPEPVALASVEHSSRAMMRQQLPEGVVTDDLIGRNHHHLRSDKANVIQTASLSRVRRIEVVDRSEHRATAVPVQTAQLWATAIVVEGVCVDRLAYDHVLSS